MEDNPRDWHNLLLDVLWAYRTSPRSSIGITPCVLVYEHDVELPVEINIKSLRVKCQDQLSTEQYHQSMFLELENVDEARILALNNILFQKKKVAKSYNKKVKHISFDESDLEWKTIFPVSIKSYKFGKWSPNWEGPYQVHRVLPGKAYHLRNLNGYVHLKKINGRYLKPYYSTMWETQEV